MKINKKTITALGFGLALNVLAGVYGCSRQIPYEKKIVENEKVKYDEPEKNIRPTFFAEIPAWWQGGATSTSGDFDGDGDLDVFVGVIQTDNRARFYIFKNDGKGNFSQ